MASFQLTDQLGEKNSPEAKTRCGARAGSSSAGRKLDVELVSEVEQKVSEVEQKVSGSKP
ncbi:hypothetical protein NQZ68_020129 [Dissostichus eleginoides]|nr:hypothetical protein NQZ68_020129 [Dissostichus eleginoides]